MDNLFSGGQIVEIITAEEVVVWTKETGVSRLFLPPIQRSVVWRNSQIINYWDSLLRGYPAGMMMVHRSRQTARTLEGTTSKTGTGDFDLFDGQQRLTAILLGHETGQLNARIKLWVDLGVAPNTDSGLLFQLRVNSTGQPFGYQEASPNEKHSLGQRSAKIAAWKQANNFGAFVSEEAFNAVSGKDLIGSQCAFPLHRAISRLLADGETLVSEEISRECPEAPPERIASFVLALGDALKRPIIFQLVDQAIIENEDEYIRYFGRLGQGGTPLTNDELTYSIIKHQYPHVHDRMKEIMDGPAGRIASEVNLVLAALRVAKVYSDWDGEGAEWKIIGRPYPAFVSGLKQLPEVLNEFQQLIPASRGGRLQELLEAIRRRLAYNESTNPYGLPVMLLARMPHQLVDVLILLQNQAAQEQSENSAPDMLPAFVLHWLLFVSDSDKAAWMVFQQHRKLSATGGQCSIPILVQEFEKVGIARVLPHKKQLPLLREEIERGTHRLRSWPERFAGLDADSERKSGDALRVLSGDRELTKRAMMWLQRKYLAENFLHFDPTSSRDEDLPVDLDHLIPSKKFGFNWKSRDSFIQLDDPEGNFRNQRGNVGNSLGNFRWLGASENRSRGAGTIDIQDCDVGFINDSAAWNNLIKKTVWDQDDVGIFQKLIDLRTVDLFEKLLNEGHLESIILDSSPTPPTLETVSLLPEQPLNA
jgi:hypothetical protein